MCSLPMRFSLGYVYTNNLDYRIISNVLVNDVSCDIKLSLACSSCTCCVADKRVEIHKDLFWIETCQHFNIGSMLCLVGQSVG